ncbi:MAG: DNA topoisomerase IV subunit A [Nanobdellota archaeon]
MSSKHVTEKISSIAKEIFTAIQQGKPPKLETPVRSLSNVTFDKNNGYFNIKNRMKTRTLTASTVKSFAQTLRLMALSNQLIAEKDTATKREAYYVSKNWGDARFTQQPESDSVMDDIEAMLRVNREQMGFIPGEHGGAVAGELTVIDEDAETKQPIEIDCTRFGSGAYSIPSSVEHLSFETKAKFILAIETQGAFERLNKHKFWKKQNCILIAMSGVPTRACRRFIRKLSDDKNLPVLVFTDGDPYGYGNIYRTLKVGSGNAAHINEYFCVPKARFIGVTPYDIETFKLPTHPLKEIDVKKIKELEKNDPFIQSHPEWQKALKKMLSIQQRVEQQAFASHGLNYVMDKYLPSKIDDSSSWLP